VKFNKNFMMMTNKQLDNQAHLNYKRHFKDC